METPEQCVIKTPELRQWRRFVVLIVNFEHISHIISMVDLEGNVVLVPLANIAYCPGVSIAKIEQDVIPVSLLLTLDRFHHCSGVFIHSEQVNAGWVAVGSFWLL